MKTLLNFIFFKLIKNPFGFIPISFLLLQIFHKINIRQHKLYFLKEFPVSVQILLFTMNVSYVINNPAGVFTGSFYLYVIVFTQGGLWACSSMISRSLYEGIKAGLRKYIYLIAFFIVFPILGLGALVYSMGFRL